MSVDKRVKRASNPDYIYNPKTGRYIKKTGKTYQKLLLDNVANLNPDDRKNNVVATGTPEELAILQTKLRESPVFATEGKELAVKGGTLRVVRKKVDKKAIRSKISNVHQDVAIENRELFKSDLTDDQVKYLLGKIADMKLMGKAIDVKAEVNQLLGIKANLAKRPRGRPRFRVLPPPATDDETDYGTDSIT